MVDHGNSAKPGAPVKANQITTETYNQSHFGRALGQEEDEADNMPSEYDFETMIKVK